MASKIDKWQSEDGDIYDSEIEALRADVTYLKRKLSRAGGAPKDPKAPRKSAAGNKVIPDCTPGPASEPASADQVV